MTPITSASQEVRKRTSRSSRSSRSQRTPTISARSSRPSTSKSRTRSSRSKLARTSKPRGIVDTAISWNDLRRRRSSISSPSTCSKPIAPRWKGDVLAPIEEWARIADLHRCVDAVSAYVRGRVTYLPGATSVSATAQEAWDLGEGVCQDLTHITIGLLRALGIPASYVSGYLFPLDDGDVGLVVAGQSHAWIEYFSGRGRAWIPRTAYPRRSVISRRQRSRLRRRRPARRACIRARRRRASASSWK